MTTREILINLIGELDDARNCAEIDSFEANRDMLSAICAGKAMAFGKAIEMVADYLQDLEEVEE